MNLNTKLINKDEKRKIILRYVKKIYDKEKRFVSKREIRKKFHVELYNYFKNIFDLYQCLGIDVPLCFCPRDYAIKKIVEYVKAKAKKEIYPTKKEIEADLGIHIYSYYNGIKQLYKATDVDFNLYKRRVYDLETHFNSDEVNVENKNKILNLIKRNVKEGIYPSTIFIQEKLNLSFYKYFKSIYEAYKKAEVGYERPCPIILGREKEKVLTEISVILLQRMGYKIKRISIIDKESYNKGEDICIIDSDGKEFVVELKAYGKTKRVSKREISQLVNYVNNKQKSKGILITTSELVSKTKENILVLDGKKLVRLLHKYRLTSFLEEIKWIQLAKVNKKEILETKNKKRREIVKFILDNPEFSKPKEIEKVLKLDLRTYFQARSINLINKIKENPNIYSAPVCKVPS